jgi:single-strand DNA-binding protein
MNVLYFTGNVGGDAEVRSVASDKVCNFNVAVKQGYGRDAPTAWYRVEVWGKRGEGLAPHVKKGGKVAVCGELIIDEYQGKPQYRVRAYEVDPFCNGQSASTGGGSPQTRQVSPAFDSDLDDDVPFATNDPAWERRVS